MGHDLQQTRYDQLIRRVGAIIGPGSKVAEALSELFPVIDVERVPGELLILGGTAICIGTGELTSDVAETPHIQLFNPVGSGKLITVTRFNTGNATNMQVRYAVNNVARADGLGTERFRDSRLGLVSRPVGQIRSESLVAFVDQDGAYRPQINHLHFVSDENGVAVLSPGFGLEVGNQNTNSLLECTFFWRERVAEQSELNLP